MKSTYGYVTDGSFSHNLPFYSRIWFRPLGVHLGLRPSRAHRRAHENPYLEKVPKCRCFLADCLLYVKISQNKCQATLERNIITQYPSPFSLFCEASCILRCTAYLTVDNAVIFNHFPSQVYQERRPVDETVARESHMTERQVERWLRKRKLQNRPSTLDKFAETG